jgi:hypothetical protein
MIRQALVSFALLVVVMTTSQAAPIATFAPPIAWSFPGSQKLVVADKPDGGPDGKAWTEVTYAPGAYANLHAPQPLSLPPGTLLKVWVKGNGTKDVLYLYMFGGEGHRGYNLPLKDTAWKEIVFDISEDFGENDWCWDKPVRMNLDAVQDFRLFTPDSATPKAPPIGLGPITLEAPARGAKPAIMLATCNPDWGDPNKTYRILPHLQAAGYEVCVKHIYGVGSGVYLNSDQLARFNAVILLDLPEADKGGYPKNFARVADVLHEYVEKGGGLFFTAIPSGWNNVMPTINQFLEPWGAKLLDEQVVDPDNVVQSDAWFQRYPFCWTDNVAPHPITQGVKGTWYPGKAWRADGILTTVAFTASPDWQVLLRGKDSARSVRAKGDDLVTQPPLSIASAPPIFAVRQVGKGRVGLLPIYPSFVTGGCDHPSWNSMVWDGTAKGLRSDMKPLFLNAVKWLAEPSLQDARLGGYIAPKTVVDYRPQEQRAIPLDWAQAAFAPAQHQDYLALVGMQSNLSGGASTPAAMIDAARAAGYQIAIFAEPVEGMNAAKWKDLSQVCAAASGKQFLALPGLRYRDPQGNSYMLFGNMPWPDDEWYRKCFNDKGQVIDTYTLWAKVSAWRHVAIHSLTTKKNPILHLRHYSCVAVFTYQDDRLTDDSYDDYLLLEENCYYPIPLAVHFVSSPEGVAKAKSGFQTRLWAASLRQAADILDGGKAGDSYFSNPQPTYLSSGPRLTDWQEINMNSWRATAPGTDRWEFRLGVQADAPLSEVRIMDGTHLYRDFRPSTPTFALDHVGHHGKQQQFTVRARDARGGEMISSHLKTHTMEHVFFMCADRQNSLGEGSWGYEPWPAQYDAAPHIDIYDLFPPFWDGGAAGFGSFCEAVLAPAKDVDIAGENDLGMLACTKRTVFASRDCTITREVGEGKFQHRDDWGDCKPTPALLPRKFIADEVTRYHYRVAENAPGYMLVEGKVRALADTTVASGPTDLGVIFYMLSDNGSKGGELQYFAYAAADGTRQVRATPEGAQPFYRVDTAKPGDYLTTFPRRLGAPALFPLTPVTYGLWGAPNIFGTNFGTPIPGGKVKAGDAWSYRFLYSCFTSKTGEMNETPERIRRMYGLAGQPGYSIAVKQGTLLGAVYELCLKAADGAAVVDLGKADVPGSLPIVVEGLNDRWSTVIAEGAAAPRFIGVFEGHGYAVTDLREGAKSLFVGHPVRAGDDRLFLNLTDWSATRAVIEVHNPTASPISTWVATSAACKFLPAGKVTVTIAPGTSQMVEIPAR